MSMRLAEAIPTQHTIGDIRREIDGLPDDAPFCICYHEVETEYIFVRTGGLVGHNKKLILSISLIDSEAHNDEAEDSTAEAD